MVEAQHRASIVRNVKGLSPTLPETFYQYRSPRPVPVHSLIMSISSAGQYPMEIRNQNHSPMNFVLKVLILLSRARFQAEVSVPLFEIKQKHL